MTRVYQHFVLVLLALLLQTSDAFGQSLRQPELPLPKVLPTGEWHFNGTEWQFIPGNAGAPSVAKPVVPTTPVTQSYPKLVYPQPLTGPKLVISGPGFGIAIGGSVPVQPAPYWVVTYRKYPGEPWVFYANYGSSEAAFAAAHGLSHKGFYAGVTRRN